MNATYILPGRLRLTRIVYQTDLTRNGSGSVPLGVMADIKCSHVYGLGLIALDRLPQPDLMKIGRLARPLMEQPFKTLESEFLRVWSSAAKSDTFAQLPLRNFASLQFQPLESCPVNAIEISSVKGLEDIKQWAERTLMSKIDQVFSDMFDGSGSMQKAHFTEFDEAA